MATAKCCGIRGNDLKVAIAANVDGDGFDVKLYLDAQLGFPDGSIRG